MLNTTTPQKSSINPGSKQYADLKAAFDFFDKNHSGQINVSELDGAMKNIGKNLSQSEIGDMMSSLDKDNDGYLGIIF